MKKYFVIHLFWKISVKLKSFRCIILKQLLHIPVIHIIDVFLIIGVSFCLVEWVDSRLTFLRKQREEREQLEKSLDEEVADCTPVTVAVTLLTVL